MKANEFVGKFGWDEAKRIINENTVKLGLARYISMWERQDFEELKRLVESHNMIENFGGLEEAKAYERMYASGLFTGAIKDVESCNVL